MRVFFAALLLAAPLGAQTQGVANVNDYTVGCFGCLDNVTNCSLTSGSGGTAGSTSGGVDNTFLFDLSTSGLVTFSVDGAPGNSFVFLLYNAAACATLQFPLDDITSYGISPTANFWWTNQTIDMSLFPGPVTITSGVTNPSGDFTAAASFGNVIFGCQTVCTQAVIIDVGALPSGYLVTQAYDITFR